MGFAQEIKEFTSSYAAISEIGMRQKQQKLDEKKTNHDIEYENAMLALKQAESAQKLAGASGGTGGTGGSGGTASGAGNTGEFDPTAAIAEGGITGALPVDTSTTEARTTIAKEKAVDGASGAKEDEDPGAVAEEGDAIADEVLGFAEGGLVEEPKPAPMPSDPRVALPLGDKPNLKFSPQPAAAPAPTTPAVKPADPQASTIVVRKAMQATEAALDGFEKSLKVPKQAVGGEDTSGQPNIMTGEGGMTPGEYEQVRSVVDPNNAIPSRLRSAATASALYEDAVARGDEKQGVKMAQAYLVGELRVNQTLGFMAGVALEKGNAEAACKIVNDACSRFPSGHQIVVAPMESGRFGYEVFDPSGKSIEKEVISTDNLMEAIKGIEDGSLYRRMLAQTVVASRPKGEDGAKPGTYAEALQGVASATSDLIKADTAYRALGEDVPYEERKAAHDAITVAAAAVEAAKQAAVTAGTTNKDASKEAAVVDSVNKAAVVPEGFAIPEAPPAPGEASPAEEPGFLGKIFGGMGQGGVQTPPAEAIPTGPTPAVTPPGNIPTPQTQEEYDALAPGTIFIDPEDGKQYKKP